MAQLLAYGQGAEPRSGDSSDIDQIRRVCWLAFTQDTDENILRGNPTTTKRRGVLEPIPLEDPRVLIGSITAAEGDFKVNIFTLRLRLAVLQSEAIDQIFSLAGPARDPQHLASAVHDFLRRLRTSRKHELFTMDAPALLQLLYRADVLHVLSLECSYYALKFRLQSLLVRSMTTSRNPFSLDVMTALAAQPMHDMIQDARRVVDITCITPLEEVGLCWALRLPVVAALMTVLAHHLHTMGEKPATPVELNKHARILRVLEDFASKRNDAEIICAHNLCKSLNARVCAKSAQSASEDVKIKEAAQVKDAKFWQTMNTPTASLLC